MENYNATFRATQNFDNGDISKIETNEVRVDYSEPMSINLETL